MDREQFTRHVEKSSGELRRFLTALCLGDADLADDIAQETLIKAYLSSDGFGNAERFNAWIFRIAYNTFIDNRRATRLTVSLDEASELSNADTADATFRYQDLYAALDRLSPRERTSLLLHYMEGYDIKAIAEITGSTVDAVKQQLSRGRTHLRNLL